jgi:hypothetical protein
MASKENVRARQLWEELLAALTPTDHEPTPDEMRAGYEIGRRRTSQCRRTPDTHRARALTGDPCSLQLSSRSLQKSPRIPLQFSSRSTATPGVHCGTSVEWQCFRAGGGACHRPTPRSKRALLRRLAGSADAGEQLRDGVRGLLALVVES